MEVRTQGSIQPVVQPLQTKSDRVHLCLCASSHVSPRPLSLSVVQSVPLCSVLYPEAEWSRQRLACSVKGFVLLWEVVRGESDQSGSVIHFEPFH